MDYYLGIDMGGTTISAGIFSKDGKLMTSESIPTRERSLVFEKKTKGTENLLDRIAGITEELMEVVKIPQKTDGTSGKIQENRLLAAGITVPGLLEGAKGPVLFAPNVGWENVNPVPCFEQRLGCPVFLVHDAQSAAVAENRWGEGRHFSSFLFLTLGTAIGAAFIWEGKLFSQHGVCGAELGHIPLRGDGIPCSCGLPGCFQQYGSAEALRYQTIAAAKDHPESEIWEICGGELGKISSKTVFQALQRGDQTAEEVLERFTGYLAEGIAGLTNIFRPEAVVIGGGLSNAGETLLEPVREKLPKYTHAAEKIGVPQILRAKLGDEAGMFGAALYAAENS